MKKSQNRREKSTCVLLKVKPLFSNTVWEKKHHSELVTFLQTYLTIESINVIYQQPSFKIFVLFDNQTEAEMAVKSYDRLRIPGYGVFRVSIVPFYVYEKKRSIFDFESRDHLSLNRIHNFFHSNTLVKNKQDQQKQTLMMIFSRLEFDWSYKQYDFFYEGNRPPLALSTDSVDNRSHQNGSKPLKKEFPKYDPIPSKVVLAVDLNNFFESVFEILNLFNWFGQIKKILFLRNQQKALVEYHTFEDSYRCLNYSAKDGLPFRLFYSHYKEIDPESNKHKFGEENYNDFLFVSWNVNRFHNPKLPIPGISRNLIVYALFDQNVPQKRISFVFCKIFNLFGIRTKDAVCVQSSDDRITYKIQTQNVEVALLMMKKLHFQVKDGLRLFVNFYQNENVLFGKSKSSN